jgi:hypothetical protein
MSRSVPPSELPEADYLAVEEMVKETPLGRWFLEEHARRSAGGEGASAVDALSRLSELGGGADTERLNEILDLIAEARHDPANARSAKSAASGIGAIRQVIDKIREVAFELREAGRLDIYASALELYCSDMLGAADAQEGSVRRVADLSRLLGKVEKSIADITGREIEEQIEEWEPAGLLESPNRALPAPVAKAVADAEEARRNGPMATLIGRDEIDPPEATVPEQPSPLAATSVPAPAEPTQPEPVAEAPVETKAENRVASETNAAKRGDVGGPSAMNEEAIAEPREPAPFQPTKTASEKEPGESASAKLVRDARALFFVNPT